jgi:radical SAM superfamily enzyme YgiQ (UPF0313 family)
MSLLQIKSSKEGKIKFEEKIKRSTIDLKIKKTDVKIWLADLTYTQQQISSEAMPAAIGGIATFTETSLGLTHPIRIFKYPEKLSSELENSGTPDIIGFSNYLWDLELSLAFARIIKEVSPKTITIFGGPNYPVLANEQERFLRSHPEIDFYVKREGELAFANLVAALVNVDLNKNAIKKELPSVHFIDNNGNAVLTETIERIKDLTEIPSPYLTGKMDEFFDGKFQPILQTNRGCPFSCTFCVEGELYYNKVYHNSQEKVDSELDYIGKKMEGVRKKGGGNNLLIVDSNFGMFNEDKGTCESIARCQDEYNWPDYIHVNTGKNNKEKVLNAAKLVRGAIRLSGSVQTLDPQTLKNIKRSNISADGLMSLAMESAEINADSRSEIILCLPGETKKSHFDTIRTIIEAGFSQVNSYQLMMLPGTDLCTDETREKYELQMRYRVLPRDFGYYQTLGKRIVSAEIEEICVSTNTLSFEDYVDCRKMHLIVGTIYNNSIFGSVLKFLKSLGISCFRWIELIYNAELHGKLKQLVEEFEASTRNELWVDRKELQKDIQKPGYIERYISGELGLNLLHHYSGKAFTQCISELVDLSRNTLHKLLKENEKDTEENLAFVEDALVFDSCRYKNIFKDIESEPTVTLNYEIHRFVEEKNPNPIENYHLKRPLTLKFILDEMQKDTIKRSLQNYGADDVGISRIITKVLLRKLLRKPVIDSQIPLVLG